MVARQLETRDIHSPQILQAMRKVPRPLFIPEPVRGQAFEDGPVCIGAGQTISQPYIVAFMTQALEVCPGERVLEIGTGSGYQTAVLAELGAEVFSVEIVETLHQEAAARLKRLRCKHVHLRLGNGWEGWPEKAPFDKILVSAAPDKIPPTLADQLRDGGKMIIPVGSDQQHLILGVKQGGHFKKIETIPVRFVPMVGETAAQKKEAQDQSSS